MSFEEVLASCLDALAAGQSIEACLANYPEYAGELEPLLRVAFLLDETAFPAMPDSGFERGRAAVRTAAQTRRLEQTTPHTDATPLATGSIFAPRAAANRGTANGAAANSARVGRGWPLAFASAATAGILLALVLLSQTNGIVPGSWLYPVKRLGEQAQGVLLAAAGEDATWQARLVARRVGELYVMKELGQPIDPQLVEEVVVEAEAALTSSAQLAAPERAEALETLQATLDEAVAVIPPEAEELRARIDEVVVAAGGGESVAMQSTPAVAPAATPLPQPTQAPTFMPTPTWTPLPTLGPTATREQPGRPLEPATPGVEELTPTPTTSAPVLVFEPPTPPIGGDLAGVAALDGRPSAAATLEEDPAQSAAAAGESPLTLFPAPAALTPDESEPGFTITEPILLSALTLSPTLEVVLALTATPTLTPTLTLTPSAVLTPSEPLLPTPTFTAEPVEPTTEPNTEPTAEPTTGPTAEPTTEPTAEPTATPTAEFVPTPTLIPVETPTSLPPDSPVPLPTPTQPPPDEPPPTETPIPTEPPEPTPTPTETPTQTPTPTDTPLPPPTPTEPIPTATTPGELPAPAPPL